MSIFEAKPLLLFVYERMVEIELMICHQRAAADTTKKSRIDVITTEYNIYR